MDWLTDNELIAAEVRARKLCHDCPVYTGNQIQQAVRSGARSAALADEWMRYRAEMKKRGITSAMDFSDSEND